MTSELICNPLTPNSAADATFFRHGDEYMVHIEALMDLNDKCTMDMDNHYEGLSDRKL